MSRDRFSMYEQSLQSVTSQGHPQMDRLGCPIEMEPKTLNEGELSNARVNILTFFSRIFVLFPIWFYSSVTIFISSSIREERPQWVSVLESTVESSHGGR